VTKCASVHQKPVLFHGYNIGVPYEIKKLQLKRKGSGRNMTFMSHKSDGEHCPSLPPEGSDRL